MNYRAQYIVCCRHNFAIWCNVECANDRCLFWGCHDNFARQQGAVWHLDMQDIELLTREQLLYLSPIRWEWYRHTVLIETNRYVAAQAMDIWNITASGFANEVMDIVTLLGKPLTNAQDILLYSISRIERVVEHKANFVCLHNVMSIILLCGVLG